MHNATLSFTFTFFLHDWEAGRHHNSGLMEFLRPNFFSWAVIRIVVIGVNGHFWLVFAQQDDKLFGTVLCHAGWCFTHLVHRVDHQAIHIWIRKRSHAHAGLIGGKFLPEVGLLVPLWHPTGSSMPSDKPKRITIGFRRFNQDRLCVLIESFLLVTLASDNFVDFKLVLIQIWRTELLIDLNFSKWSHLALSVSKGAWQGSHCGNFYRQLIYRDRYLL